jgi:hypothetical protein
MSVSGPGAVFGAEYGDICDGELTKPLERDCHDQIAPGNSPAPASMPTIERVRVVLDHNKFIREGLLRETDNLETDIAYYYIDGFIKGIEWARGIKKPK